MPVDISNVFNTVSNCWYFIPWSLRAALLSMLGIFAFWSVLRFIVR